MKTWKHCIGIFAIITLVFAFTACASGGASAGNTVPPEQVIQATEKNIEDTTQQTPANFVRVEGGTFQMGSNNGEDPEKPVHTVTITGFYMGKYEVTQKEWTVVMGSNPSNFKGDNLPVENVHWYDAVEFCNRLSEREGLIPYYTINKTAMDPNNDSDLLRWLVTRNISANGYRLPTEAEWEYAARGGAARLRTTPMRAVIMLTK